MELFFAIAGVAAATIVVGLGIISYINNIFSFAERMNQLLGKAPRPATREQAEETLRLLKELQEKLAPSPQGAADIGTDELAKAAGPDTEARLRDALLLQAQGKEREAIDALYEAFRRDLSPRAKAQLHNLIGISFSHLSEFEEAEGHYRQALDASRAANLPEGEAAALGNLGNVCLERGDLDQTEEYYSQALAINRETGDRRDEAGALGNLGVVYRRRGDLDQAEEHFKQSLVIHREIGSRLNEASALGNLGNIYLARRDSGQAEEYHQRSLEIKREIGNRLGEARSLGNLGNVYRHRGNLARAKDHYEQALAIDSKIGYRLGQAQDLGNLGMVAAQRDQKEEACQLLKEAAAIFEEIGAQSLVDQARANLQKLGCE